MKSPAPGEWKKFLPALTRIAAKRGPALEKKHGLRCSAGSWLDSAVLKVDKAHWFPAPAGRAGPSGGGIFFSVWVDAESVRQHRVLYNLHALKLRTLPGHRIQSRAFAAAFRAGFRGRRAGWPNVSINHGPQTLMQGWIELDPAHFESDVTTLLERFVAEHQAIDVLLEERKAV